MTAKEFLEKVFGALLGDVDMSLPVVMPTLYQLGGVDEYSLEVGTDPNTFYAIDTYSLCPRAYMLKYLAGFPLSVPFYAQVLKCARDTIAKYVLGNITKEKMYSCFQSMMSEIVVGPFPIHVQGKDWCGDYAKSFKEIFEHFEPLWEREGWIVSDTCVPICLKRDGLDISGTIDIVLKNEVGQYAIVIHELGGAVYVNKSGEVSDDEEGMSVVRQLKRKAYLYATALFDADARVDKLSVVMLNLLKPKSRNESCVLKYEWNDLEAEQSLSWAQSKLRQIRCSTDKKEWPAVEVYRHGRDGKSEPDRNFCQQRCVHCLACRWAGWHPEKIERFTGGKDIAQLPQKYIGVRLRLKPGLDHDIAIGQYKGTCVLDSGKAKSASFVKKVLEKANVSVIGDLEGKSICDFASVTGCGVAKIDTIVGLFYDVVDGAWME